LVLSLQLAQARAADHAKIVINVGNRPRGNRFATLSACLLDVFDGHGVFRDLPLCSDRCSRSPKDSTAFSPGRTIRLWAASSDIGTIDAANRLHFARSQTCFRPENPE
jgi:hypothetical protein